MTRRTPSADPPLIPWPRELTRLDGAEVLLPADGLDAVLVSIDASGPPESYRLEVAEGAARITAADRSGLQYARTTLAQLARRGGDGWVLPAVRVVDAPRFAYRGVMLDVARHFQSVDTVKAFIDRAAALKFNHLHLHLSDDQGWRLAIPSHPLLVERGSTSSVGGDPGGWYTVDDYAAIIEYAAARGMSVVPEIDLPGHSHAFGLAYPELVEPVVITDEVREAAASGGLPLAGQPYTGIAVGFSSVRITEEQTYRVLTEVLGEIAAMTPGPLLHIGGDECHGTDPDDYASFMARLSGIVAGLGRTPVTWHEAGAVAALQPGTIGQYWGFTRPGEQSAEQARAFVRAGSRLIMSPADVSYLDIKPRADHPLGLSWVGRPTTLRDAYEWDPARIIEGVGEEALLGVEAALWTETVRTLSEIDQLAFPRIAAIAEIAWSGPPGGAPQRSWASFRERVAGLAPAWRAAGVDLQDADQLGWD